MCESLCGFGSLQSSTLMTWILVQRLLFKSGVCSKYKTFTEAIVLCTTFHMSCTLQHTLNRQPAFGCAVFNYVLFWSPESTLSRSRSLSNTLWKCQDTSPQSPSSPRTNLGSWLSDTVDEDVQGQNPFSFAHKSQRAKLDFTNQNVYSKSSNSKYSAFILKL